MKIALIHYRIMLRGGLETRLVNYTGYLTQQGHEITIICAKKTKDVTFPAGVNIVHLPSPFAPKPFRMFAFNRKVNRWLKSSKYDFTLSFGRTCNHNAILAAGDHMGYLKAMDKKILSFSDIMQQYMDRRSFSSARCIFAASSMIKNELINYYNVRPEIIHVLFPPLNTSVFYPPQRGERDILRSKYGIPASVKVFVFVSSSHRRKGLDLLIRIFKLLKNDNCMLVIAGSPEVRSTLDNVRYLGHVSDPRKLYVMADFTIHPALYEPFGQIISESLACKTPVIISSMVGAREVVDPQSGIVIENFDPGNWADILRDLKSSDFVIPDDIIQSKVLSLEQHMEKMLKTIEEQDF